ncbi:MAG: hypothetical protein ABIH92_03065 [Nanoarchaeota archaeon]
MKTTRIAIFTVLIASVLAGIGQIAWKKSTESITFPDITTTLLNPYLLAGIIIYILATFLLMLSFKHGELSALYPLLATSYVWVVLISPIIFTSEQLTLPKILGVIIIFSGVSLIGLRGANGK